MSKRLPKEERYGLTSEVRRAAVSIPSNIAKGYGRETTAGYLKSLYISFEKQTLEPLNPRILFSS